MITKIYLGQDVVIATKQVNRYKIAFVDNPANSSRIALDIKKNGSVVENIDKTFNTSTSDILLSIRTSTSIGTATNLYNNLTEFNTNSITTYSQFGGEIYVDVIGELTDTFTFSVYENSTSGDVVITNEGQLRTFDETEVGYNLLDLFDDETIEITSKMSDIERLSNVFTDFSNSFTVPATPNNSALFKHYYDIDIDNTFNANIRVPAYIEIESYPFRYGLLQLEQVQLKDQKPESYKISFFGGLTQLSDLFGEDTINTLDYDTEIVGGVDTLIKVRNILSQFDYQYTSQNLVDSLYKPSFKNGSVITPLIAYADRDWNYREGQGSAEDDKIDISINEGAIVDTELRPALRIYHIIEGIEAKYNITFSRNFLGSAVFNNLFMWMNGNTNVTGDRYDIVLSYFEENDTSLYYNNVSIANNVFSFTDTGYNWESGNFYNLSTYILDPEMKDGSSAVGTNITFELLDEDGNVLLSETKTVNSNTPYLSWNYFINQSNGFSVDYAFRFRFFCSDDIKYSGTRVFLGNNFGTGPYDTVIVFGESNLMIKPETLLPNMKVTEFLQGIMKQFKLIIRPITSTSFYLDTLNGYYSRGNYLDITPFTDQTTVTLQRPIIYKKILFKYQKTSNVLGKKFRETYDLVNDEVGYGDLRAVYKSINSKEELKVELPFENMLFERLTNLYTGDVLNITIGQSISTNDYKTFNKNNSKAILFFNNGINSHPDSPIKLKFSENTPIGLSYSYNIGNTNDYILEQVTDTINWGAEIDPWHNSVVANSLYLNYWKTWLDTIYSLRQRKFSYKAYLPQRYIEELSLNDRIIIGSNRYKIEDYKVNLATGETTLNLFSDIYAWSIYDFPSAVGDEYFEMSQNSIYSNAGTKYYSVNFITNQSWTATLVDDGYGTDWVEIMTPSGTGSTEFVFKIKENNAYTNRQVVIEVDVPTIAAFEITILQYGLGT
jgi:hypothetical protein